MCRGNSRLLVLGVLVLVLAATAPRVQAGVTMLDNPVATPWQATGGGTMTQSYTVSAAANELIVCVMEKTGTVGPATITWDNHTMNLLAGELNGNSTRYDAIYYLPNPYTAVGGTGASVTGNVVGVWGGGYVADAFTLTGVDTNVTPLTAVNNNGGNNINPISANLTVASTGSWLNAGGLEWWP